METLATMNMNNHPIFNTEQRRKKILLVDDSETMLMMEKMILGKKPYNLVFARNGLEAVQQAQKEKPDLILMDVVMPKMDGITACHEIRALQEVNGTPIILLTTRGEEECVESGFQNGCSDYLTKPINSVELLSTVKHYLGE